MTASSNFVSAIEIHGLSARSSQKKWTQQSFSFKLRQVTNTPGLAPSRALYCASPRVGEAVEEGKVLRTTRLYLDSADIQQWEKWSATDLFYGYTTNPTILRRDGVKCTIPSLQQLASRAFKFGAQELQLQAWGTNASEFASVGRALHALDKRVVVKLPITLDGVKAAKVLHNSGISVTLTGIYAPHQIVTALACGASYAAPYLGRMNDAGLQGMEAIHQMLDMIGPAAETNELRLLVASIRNPEEIADLAAQGCNTFTISPAVAQRLFEERLTNDAAGVFQEHAVEMGASVLD